MGSRIDNLKKCFSYLEELPAILSGFSIKTDDGHIDTDLLIDLITWETDLTRRFIDAKHALTLVLDPDGEIEREAARKEQERKALKEFMKAGAKWSPEQIFEHCTLDGNAIKLPNVHFHRDHYLEVKKRIEAAGGKWEGGKIQGFVFPYEDISNIFEQFQKTGHCSIKSDFQYYSTPVDVADWLVSLADIRPTDTILEPSAGTGAIISAIHRSCPSLTVDCYELMPENKAVLEKMEGVRVLGDNFLDATKNEYTKIIANPPFKQNQDIKHVRRMYGCLAIGGTLVSVMSKHWTFAQENESVEFRQWLGDLDADRYDIPAGAFDESGTSIPTIAVRIMKKREKTKEETQLTLPI